MEPRTSDRSNGQDFAMIRMIDNGGQLHSDGTVSRQQVDGGMLGMRADDPDTFPCCD